MRAPLTLSLVVAGLSGLRTVSDDGEALYAALEAWATSPRGRKRFTSEVVRETVARTGTVSAAARELGISRSTVRYACEVKP